MFCTFRSKITYNSCCCSAVNQKAMFNKIKTVAKYCCFRLSNMRERLRTVNGKNLRFPESKKFSIRNLYPLGTGNHSFKNQQLWHSVADITFFKCPHTGPQQETTEAVFNRCSFPEAYTSILPGNLYHLPAPREVSPGHSFWRL
jgi:hypothetical protein